MQVYPKYRSAFIGKAILLLLFSHLFVLSSCSQDEPRDKIEVLEVEEEAVEVQEERPYHPYGGWYCPDNLFGFPAVDIDTLEKIPVIRNRLPTREEARSGQSLIFVDTEKYPDARALDIPLPQLARYYNHSSKKDELIIVIQAIAIGQDSVVGFRYVNGGNGSSWLDEVEFLEESAVDALPATPFVSEHIEIKSNPESIWKVLTNPDFSGTIAKSMGDGMYRSSDWVRDAKVYNKFASGVVHSTGNLTAVWPSVYIQIDYDFAGQHYVEKVFLPSNTKEGIIDLQFVAGPFGSDYNERRALWKAYLEEVKTLSERVYLAEQFNPLRN